MKYLAAYLLLVAGGNATPTSDDIKKVIAVVGGEVDDVRLSQLMNELEGKDVNEIISAGKEKLITISAGGGGAAPAAAAGGDDAAAAPAAAAPKEEEVDALEGGMDMFGGGGGGDY